MPVKNIFSPGISGHPKPIPIFHAIPPVADADFKVKIETSSTTIDLSDLILSGSYLDGVTDTIGAFEFKIIDPNKTIYNQVISFDEIVIYGDYGTPTNARFRGKIERKGYLDSYLTISGRSVGMIFSEKNIIYSSYGDKSKSEILKEIISANFPNVDIDNIETNSDVSNVNYYEIPFTQIIEEICGDTHDFYLNHNYEAHYFTKGSRVNTTEIISQDQNHIETIDNSDDTEKVYSKIRVYGNSEDGIPVIYTKDIGTVITKDVTKEYKIDNSSVINTEQAEYIANSEATKSSSIPHVGTISSLYLPTLLPGEKIFIAIPREEIPPAYYEVIGFTNEFDLNSDIFAKTTINLKKNKVNISSLIKSRIKFEDQITENLNPNDLDFSRIITFKDDIGTPSNTEISEGYLKVSSGSSTGTWISPIYTLDKDISEIEIRWTGDNLVQDYLTTSAQLWFSLNGGATWKFNPILGTTSTIVSGRDLRLKVVFNSSNQKVKRLGVYFK